MFTDDADASASGSQQQVPTQQSLVDPTSPAAADAADTGAMAPAPASTSVTATDPAPKDTLELVDGDPVEKEIKLESGEVIENT